MPRPSLPCSAGSMLVLALIAPVVPQASAERERWNCAPTSTGRPKLKTQAGDVTPMKSLLLAAESHDSTLQEPGAPTSASSTAKAPPAANADCEMKDARKPANTADAIERLRI